MVKALKPAIQQITKKKIIGYDIETYNNNKNYYIGSFYSNDFVEPYRKFIYNKEEFFKEITKDRFRNSIVICTNTDFDLIGTIFKTKFEQKFQIDRNGGSIRIAKIYVKNKVLTHKSQLTPKQIQNTSSVTFLDTFSYAKISVEGMGKILGIPKLKKPSFLGKKASNDVEFEEIKAYNLRDSEISYKFLRFLYKAFEDLGATPKTTIASTSLSLFKNKFLDDIFFTHDKSDLLELLKAYYGGRTEVFSRGKFFDILIYDINSLYPSQMLKGLPDPRSHRKTYFNGDKYIKKYMGVSHVQMYAPKMKYPILPYHDKKNNKLIFGYGNIKGWYSHEEINFAIEHGYKLITVYKTHYFKKSIKVFEKFIKTLYALRLKYKKEGSQMQLVVKLLMNSLYGKFSQKFDERDEWVHKDNVTIEHIEKSCRQEEVGDYFRLVYDDIEPAHHCFPEWSLYITAYARIHLYPFLVKYDALYCDTDSIMTQKPINAKHISKKLGDWKLEHSSKQAIFIKPKFYGYTTDDKEEGSSKVKIKGAKERLSFLDFETRLNKSMKENITNDDGSIVLESSALKFTKFKEAVRRDLIPNELQTAKKQFNLEDNKRKWKGLFSMKPQDSEPLKITIKKSIIKKKKNKK